MKTIRILTLIPLFFVITSQATDGKTLNQQLGFPEPEADNYTHQSPTIDDLLNDEKISVELKKVILKGYDLFTNTQQLRGKNIFTDMNCSSCHLGGGGLNYSGPIWPAVTSLPAYRGKNKHVNNLEERIAGCFSYSMNGVSPEYGSDTMLALTAYHHWLAKGAPVFNEKPITGRGFGHLKKKVPAELSYAQGEKLFQAKCSICHGEQGQGKKIESQVVFPALWGNYSYNWGAGMARVYTLASFIQYNMPLGQPNSLTEQEAWDIAQFVNSQERPQDPRYTGDAKATREKFLNFHRYTNYGTEFNGKVLGQHDNIGDKPLLKPWSLQPRHFKAGSDALYKPSVSQ